MYSFLILSILATPNENRNIFNSATSISASCLFISATVSNPYNIAGLTATLYTFPFTLAGTRLQECTQSVLMARLFTSFGSCMDEALPNSSLFVPATISWVLPWVWYNLSEPTCTVELLPFTTSSVVDFLATPSRCACYAMNWRQQFFVLLDPFLLHWSTLLSTGFILRLAVSTWVSSVFNATTFLHLIFAWSRAKQQIQMS